MPMKQISVFVENKAGRLADITHVLEKLGLTSVRCRWRILPITVSCV